MFNVIKGEMTYQTLKPVIVGKSKEQEDTDTSINEDINKNTNINSKNQEELNKILEEINEKQEELNNINKEIEILKENSNKEIEILKEDAIKSIEKETEMAKNKGYQEGYQNGIINGEEEIIEKTKKMLESIEEIYISLENYYKDLILKNEENLINLSLKLSEKIIKKEIEKDKDIVIYNLNEAIKKITTTKTLTILVNYEDVEVVKNIKDRLLVEISGIEHIEISSSNSIPKGSCKLDTSLGTIDASLNSQLEVIYEKFMEVIPNNNGDEDNIHLGDE